MSGYYDGRRFIEILNSYLKVAAPNIVELTSFKDRHEQSLFPRVYMLQWKKGKEMDFVIEGPCSNGIDYSRDFPLGKCIVKTDAPDESWIHGVLDEYRQEHAGKWPANTLLYQDCCSRYEERHLHLIRDVFPEVAWHFPYVRDMCGHFYPERIAKSLIKEGYLEIVPIQSPQGS